MVAGKGGVGKTVASVVLALSAAARGQNVLVVGLDSLSGPGPLLDDRQPPGGPPAELRTSERELVAARPGHGWIRGRTMVADRALVDYLAEHGLARVSRQLQRTRALDVIAHAVPGIGELLVLGELKATCRDHPADLIVLDAPASGHALAFLRSPRTVATAVPVGPIRAQADAVLALFADHAHCEVVLVTLPEETPVNELLETAYALEDELGIALGPVIVNRVLPESPALELDPEDLAAARSLTLDRQLSSALSEAARFSRQRREVQQTQLERLDRELPLGQTRLPELASIDRESVRRIARGLV